MGFQGVAVSHLLAARTSAVFQALSRAQRLDKVAQQARGDIRSTVGMQHLAAFDHMRGRSYYLCVYESLLKNGLDEIAAIFSHWNLNCSEDFGPALRHPSAKASDTLKTNSTNQLEGWCRRLDEKVVERMIYVLNGLGLDFYSHDPEVDFAKLSEIAGTPVGR